MKRFSILVITLAAAFMLSACATASLDSYVNPAYSARSVNRVAVMPLTNQRISAGQALELNRAFIMELQKRNPNLRVVGGHDAVAKINDANLADVWATFLRDYATSGLPNSKSLSRVAEALQVDAVVTGAMINVKQEDSNGWNYPVTQVSIRYTMFGGKDGPVLWEITGEGKYQPYGWHAVPVFEAAKIAHDKILNDLPT
ncbi:MAG TPA: hypothetical protein VLK85_05325 [Ramlibacter sp.]|nr:hypothetical protein [Ramlibacter sp.]